MTPLDAKRPQPLTDASAIVGCIATLIAAAVMLGVLPAADGDAVNTAANWLVPAAFAAYTVLHTLAVHFTAQRMTTPVSDPRAEVLQPDGSTALEPLVALSLTRNPYGDVPLPVARGTAAALAVADPPVYPNGI